VEILAEAVRGKILASRTHVLRRTITAIRRSILRDASALPS
jgi:hypothetical protein